MITAVLDTNVLAPALRGIGNFANTLGELLRLWRAGTYLLVVSQPILDELTRTLATPYFSRWLSEAEQREAVGLLEAEAILTPLTVEVSGVATHPEDDLILATALSARAEYLVTGDRRLRERVPSYHGVQLVSPREFLEILEQQSPA